MGPLGERDGRLLLWMADPHDRYAIDAVRLATGSDVERCVGLRSEIDDLIERWHGQGRSAMGTIIETADGEASGDMDDRSEEHTSELQSLMRISYAVFCLQKKKGY